ncbi:MAG: thioredoxin domain-containing protein [Clostridiales bacterium]|nr:thioredoxin domain-containing protein [Clostridiales bacterium]
MITKPRTPNRLAREKSPYLLQHAHNPVDWYPWGDEAFQKAKTEDKPIFLSIGYSTCHWCHVMERESFEDQEVAKVLNDHYVSIKVDREERPDIDSIYMSVCQAITGQGGWPLTIIMTPDKYPFFAGTYFPKSGKYGYPGLVELLLQVKDAWASERDRLIETGGNITEAIKNSPRRVNDEKLGEETAERAFRGFQSSFDKVYGGFGGAPKFPVPHNLAFLLRYWKAKGNDAALNIVEKTLEAMYKGGIFDHVGFGFSRYSTDKRWLVPHFEKMLYDNALLAYAYTEAYQATGKTIYKDIAKKIFAYVLRDMTSGEGAFCSAEDADSEGEEGKFYLWHPEEVKEAVGKEEGEFFCGWYDIKPEGNFEGKSIPNLIGADLNEITGDSGLKSRLDSIREKLFMYREQRTRPYRDDKILTSWNGLMIAALALAGRVFGCTEYVRAAEGAYDFIQRNLVREDGRLLARYRDGEAALPAYLEDYAFLTWGLIELYQATFKTGYLKRALELNGDMLALFWDEGDGGLFLYGEDSEQLIMRPKEVYDGALPSGNSVALYNMLRLSRMTGDTGIEERARQLTEAFGGEVGHNPTAHSFFMSALLFGTQPTREVVITAWSREEARDMLDRINGSFVPFATILVNTGDEELHRIAPFTREQEMVGQKPTAYVCKNFACLQPVTEADALSAMLQ